MDGPPPSLEHLKQFSLINEYACMYCTVDNLPIQNVLLCMHTFPENKDIPMFF